VCVRVRLRVRRAPVSETPPRRARRGR